nr:immunoglobulin heavy chain junction region [Mus musculus]
CARDGYDVGFDYAMDYW